MIQRIQTIYLLLVCLLMAMTVISPLFEMKDIENILSFEACGIYFGEKSLYPTWGVWSFATLSSVIAFITIFCFKKRPLQLKLINLNTLVIILFYVVLASYFYFAQNKLGVSFFAIKYGIILPLIALIFNFLAMGKVKADEKLVRSLDRIR